MPQLLSIIPFRRIPKAAWRCMLFIVVLFLTLQGCVLALQPSNAPSQEKLRIVSGSPGDYVFRVKDAEFPVASDGRVVVDVPRMESCNMYLFGVLKVKDGSSGILKELKLIHSERVIRKLSLTDIGKLPLDAEGYHMVYVR